MTQESPGKSTATATTDVQRMSDRDLVVTRTFDAPARLVFAAWSRPEWFARWWVPEASGLKLLSCEIDVRTGGTYRLTFAHPMADKPFAFFGRYTDVVPDQRIVWTNDEGDDGAITTVTFAECDGKTLVTFHERYPTSAALDEALSGSAEALPAQFDQLADLLADKS